MTDDSPQTLDELLAQEERLQLPSFDHNDAWALGSQLVQAARERGLPLAISVRLGEQRVFHAALPGTSAENDSWIDRKSRVVDRFGHSSFAVGTDFRARGTTFEESSGLDPARFAAHGGVFPLVVRGVGKVGTVGVSGLPQADDHAFVVEQLALFLGLA
ncbi:heme-degrading domain-containing protein [Cellulomonas hominis]